MLYEMIEEKERENEVNMLVAKYLRLSLEDADLDPVGKEESNSISNQRRLIDDAISNEVCEQNS